MSLLQTIPSAKVSAGIRKAAARTKDQVMKMFAHDSEVRTLIQTVEEGEGVIGECCASNEMAAVTLAQIP